MPSKLPGSEMGIGRHDRRAGSHGRNVGSIICRHLGCGVLVGLEGGEGITGLTQRRIVFGEEGSLLRKSGDLLGCDWGEEY